MKLKGIGTIALLVAAVLLLIGATAAISAAGGEERHEGFRMDARYWWEAPPLTAYERQHVREIMVLIFDRYFGTDITRMSPNEFEELSATMGPEKEREALRLFGQYAEKRGFEVPVGIPVPGERPAEVTYWWELVDPEYRELMIARAERNIPQRLRNRQQLAEEWGVEVCLPCPQEINVMTLTPEEYYLLLNPPPLPLRLWTVEERKARPGVVAVYGRARTYSTQADIQKWLDELRTLHHSSMRIVCVGTNPLVNSTGVDHRGYFSVGLNMDELTMKEAQGLASQIYAAISERAERLGIQDVPVVFHLTKVRVPTGTIQSPEVVGTAALPSAQPGYDVKVRYDEEFEWNWDACYWWEALPTSPYHQQQAREVGILIFDRYFGIDISAMSWQELDELWDEIGHENQKKEERLFAQYATEKGFEIPGMPAPREEFVAPPDATYWWEFIDTELREGAITMAKIEFPEMVRSYWELADWKGIELPIPRPEELCVMTLTLEEYEQILAPPRFPLGRVGIEEWYERFFPGTTIVAVFGRPRTYDNPAGWFDKLREADNFMGPLIDLLFREFRVTAQSVCAAGHITVALDCELTPEEAKAIAAKIYAMKAPKAEMVGIEDVPVVFVQGWTRPTRLGTFKDTGQN